MYDSLPLATLPICALAAITGIFLGRGTTRLRATVCAAVAAMVISTLWWWLPGLFRPGASTDPQGGWGLVAVAAWSLFAIPVGIVAALIAHRQAKPSDGRSTASDRVDQ